MNIKEIILKDPLTKWALFMVMSAGTYAATVETWTADKWIALVVAIAAAWRTYMSNPNIGIKKDEPKN